MSWGPGWNLGTGRALCRRPFLLPLLLQRCRRPTAVEVQIDIYVIVRMNTCLFVLWTMGRKKARQFPGRPVRSLTLARATYTVMKIPTASETPISALLATRNLGATGSSKVPKFAEKSHKTNESGFDHIGPIGTRPGPKNGPKSAKIRKKAFPELGDFYPSG